MADTKNKAPAKPAATKPARARKPAAAKAPTAATKTPAEAAADRPKAKDTATIKINKEAGQRGQVDVAVNGRKYTLKVDKEETVSAAVLEALENSHVEFETISPLAGEGAARSGSAAPSSTVEHTAIRGEDPVINKGQPDEKPAELQQTPDSELAKNAQAANQDAPAVSDKDAKTA